MNNQQAYNAWAENYDTVLNKTRDLEGIALREMLAGLNFESVLEIGCGTGKNTEWLLSRAQNLVCADFSNEMLAKAKAKFTAENIEFIQTDIRDPWKFSNREFDLATCCLILEHIENIDFIFQQANSHLKPGGYFYIGELHPFKQYLGTKARFETENGRFELECFIHHISDYFAAGKLNNFSCVELKEWFDDDDRTGVPRLVTMIFRKN